MGLGKKTIHNLSNIKDKVVGDAMKDAGHVGVAQDAVIEPIPSYEKAPSELITQGPNNTFIIQGRDRPGNLYSGFGGRGGTQSGRIDLIAGLASSYKNKDGSHSPPNSDTMVNPNFALDGARVYISQKANIDKYMGLAAAPNDKSRGRSAVGIKADCIRIHGRGNVKIVTGKSLVAGVGADGERLSTGGKNENVGTISFIAGNYNEDKQSAASNFLSPLKRTMVNKKKLQPLVKGDELASCLEEMMDAIKELAAMIQSNTTMIQNVDTSLAFHSHPVAPWVAIPVTTHTPVMATVEPRAIMSQANGQMFAQKMEFMKIEYLNKMGSNYISSKYVFTT